MLQSLVDYEKYAKAAHRFILFSGRAANVDLTQRTLVGIGHSIGAAAL